MVAQGGCLPEALCRRARAAGSGGLGLGGWGLEDSSSDSKLESSWSLKSLRSHWDIATGLEAGDEGREDERQGRFLGGSGGFGLVPA